MVNLLENLDSFFLGHAALEDPRNAALVQFVVDDGVGTRPPFDLPGDELVCRQFVVGEVSEEGLDRKSVV